MEGCRFTLPYAVRVSDINYGGHVGNASVFNYFQDARIAYLAALGTYTEHDIGDGCSIIVAEARARYLAEMFLGNRLEIGVRTVEVKSRSFVQSYRVERDGVPTVEGTCSLVCFRYGDRRSAPLPPPFRDALARFEATEAG